MRTAIIIAAFASFAPACVGDVSEPRKPNRNPSTSTTDDGPCTKLMGDVIVRSPADMTALPRSGCYDIYGKLTVQGAAITSLAGLHALSSVNALELDHTGLTAIDTERAIGIYGKLIVTGNAKLANLKQLAFQTAPDSILIDGNTALATLDALGLSDPKLEQVDGDIAITGNAALISLPLGNLSKAAGAITVSGNAALTLIDLAKLATAGHVEIADNPQLLTFNGFAAATMTTVAGDLAIHDNPALTTLGAMSSLYRVTGGLTIANNAALTSLNAFSTSVRFVDQTLTISNNAKLADLGALKHLQLVGAIAITRNPSLVSCRANEIDRCVPHPVASVINNNNNANCNTQCN